MQSEAIRELEICRLRGGRKVINLLFDAIEHAEGHLQALIAHCRVASTSEVSSHNLPRDDSGLPTDVIEEDRR